MPDRAKQLLFGQNSLVTTVQPNTQKTPQPMNKAQTCFWFGSPKRIFKPCLTEQNSYCLVKTASSLRFNGTHKKLQPMNKAQTCFWFGSPKRIFKPCLTEPNSYCLVGTASSLRFNRTHNYGSIEHTINLNQ